MHSSHRIFLFDMPVSLLATVDLNAPTTTYKWLYYIGIIDELCFCFCFCFSCWFLFGFKSILSLGSEWPSSVTVDTVNLCCEICLFGNWHQFIVQQIHKWILMLSGFLAIEASFFNQYQMFDFQRMREKINKIYSIQSTITTS